MTRAYRRKILVALDVDFKEEVQWVNRIAAENPKNYQIWYARTIAHASLLVANVASVFIRYHRKALVERSRDPSFELDFIAQMLKGTTALSRQSGPHLRSCG